MINTALSTPARSIQTTRSFTFSGTVISEDQREHYSKLFIGIDRVFINNKEIDFRIPVEFYTRQQRTYLGKRLVMKGRIRDSKSPNRPSVLVGRIVDTDLKGGFFGEALHLIRSSIESLLRHILKNEHYDLAMGLILGGSGRINKDLREVFSRAGIMHILAVSGLHVGFVCIFAGFILFFIPVSLRIKFLVLMLILGIYVGVTGFRPSVCRAALMAFLFGVSVILQRHVDGLHVINIAAIVFLLIDPLVLFNIGAQLSFAAVYGIFFLYPVLENKLMKKIKSRSFRFITAPLAVSFSAQLFVSPLLIYYFRRLPTLAVISNFLIIPIASVSIFLLFLTLLLGTFSFMLAQNIAALVAILLDILIMISNFIARIPFSTVAIYISPIILLLLYFLFSQKFRRVAIFSVIVISIVFSISSLSTCVVIKTAPIGTVISIPQVGNIFITSSRSLMKNAVFLNDQNIEKVDYLIAPCRCCSVKKEFFEMPDELHVKKIELGDMLINIGRQICVKYHDKEIVLDDDIEYGKEGEDVRYVISDGKEIQRFCAPLRGSILDQVIADLKLTAAKLKLLL